MLILTCKQIIMLLLLVGPYVTQTVYLWKCSATKTPYPKSVQIGMEVSTDFTNSFIETETVVINI